MADSVLTSTKKALGLAEDYPAFDPEIIMHINSVFSTLYQLGFGPKDGFLVEDKEQTWEEFIGERKNVASLKSYMYLKVRLLFDPPATSFAITAAQDQIKEFEFRLNVQREEEDHPWPNPLKMS